METLTSQLSKKFAKEIRAETDVDEALIGGFKVRVGDTIHDSSMATQLETLRQRLIHA